MISTFDYLRCNTGFNERNFAIIRQTYEQQCGGSWPDTQNELAMREMAYQLKIKIDTDECWELLSDCVSSSTIKDSMSLAKAKWEDGLKVPISSATSLANINCCFTIKKAFPQVSTFIRSFFLQPIEVSIDQNESTVLDIHCPLYLLIRKYMYERGSVTSTIDCNTTRVRLIDSINSNDDYGTWSYDYWQGLFDLELEPYNNNSQFPKQWCLADNVKIHCRIEDCTAKRETSSRSHFDGSSIISLEAFVQNVCKRENNGQSESWLIKLKEEDIFTFEHLINLNQSEWDRMQRLSMNAKRILKAAVDRQRTCTSLENSRQIIEDPTDENTEETNSFLPISDSELFASQHLIKLFVWNKLHDQRIVQRYGALPILELKCLNSAFDEMRSTGFVDDGLFDKIREFFIPFTISDKDRELERAVNETARLTRRELLKEEIKQDTIELNKWIDEGQKCDMEAREVDKLIQDKKVKRLAVLTSWKSKRSESLCEVNQDDDLLQKRQICRQNEETITKKIQEYTDKIDATNERIKMIEIELNTPNKTVAKELVKLPRGLLMYGPPGTGKSDILRQLATKLGVVMLSLPLAAGDLNRSLVGESEKIITALCLRAYQVPYAMCCVCIDEIDSLAPKRSENSTEGKIDKISVLLSLIEGVKDVPNLMIFSATNRLHMMDEAFLRRMSGKYFVGRPSSEARLKILQNIPCWALEPELYHRLSMATTNFSGAALKMLVGAIISKGIELQRIDPTYQLNESEALEIADRIAQQYQMFFGSETLPRLLLRNIYDDIHHSHAYNLSPTLKYTGRMIIDLYNRNIRIEILKNNELSIIENDLYSNEINLQTLLERLTHYGKLCNVQLLQLIDLNLLASQNAYDQNKIYETLKDRYDESISYSRSMIVYDLDALVGVNKSESDASSGRSTSTHVHNQNIYTYVLARFRDRAMEKDRIQRWAIVVIREPFLLRQFCTDAQYPRTFREEKELELEIRNAETILKCVKCKDYYIENENRMGNCSHHDGFLIDMEWSDLKICTPSQVILLSRKSEQKKDKYKWICCDKPFTDIYEHGCKRGKHGFFPDGTMQLTQALIDQWEDACRFNEEYREKRALLLKQR